MATLIFLAVCLLSVACFVRYLAQKEYSGPDEPWLEPDAADVEHLLELDSL